MWTGSCGISRFFRRSREPRIHMWPRRRSRTRRSLKSPADRMAWCRRRHFLSMISQRISRRRASLDFRRTGIIRTGMRNWWRRCAWVDGSIEAPRRFAALTVDGLETRPSLCSMVAGLAFVDGEFVAVRVEDEGHMADAG